MSKPWRILLIVALLLFFALLVGPFLLPVAPLEGTVSPEQLAHSDSQFAEIDGVNVHYKEAGQGDPPLVLLHGFASSTYSWQEVMVPLAEDHLVVAFDRPAFGLTERPIPGEWTGESPYSPQSQVELTIGLMDELGIDKAVLVGNSAGGTIAALTALTYPERVEALILVDPAIYFAAGMPGWFRLLLETPQLDRIGPLVGRIVVGTLGDDFGRAAWHDPDGLTPEVWAEYTEVIKADSWDQALIEYVKAWESPGVADRLDELSVPTLVITGDNDVIIPTRQSVRLASEIPNAELVVSPDCGHIPQEECPEAFLEATNDFLARLP